MWTLMFHDRPHALHGHTSERGRSGDFCQLFKSLNSFWWGCSRFEHNRPWSGQYFTVIPPRWIEVSEPRNVWCIYIYICSWSSYFLSHKTYMGQFMFEAAGWRVLTHCTHILQCATKPGARHVEKIELPPLFNLGFDSCTVHVCFPSTCCLYNTYPFCTCNIIGSANFQMIRLDHVQLVVLCPWENVLFGDSIRRQDALPGIFAGNCSGCWRKRGEECRCFCAEGATLVWEDLCSEMISLFVWRLAFG